MDRGNFQPPTVSYRPGPGGAEFLSGGVGSLTPETYDPALATEEMERAEANARAQERIWEIEELNQLLNLELGG